MNTFARTLIISFVLVAPLIASAQVFGGVSSSGGFFLGFGSGPGALCVGNTICQVANMFLYLINYVLVPLLFAIAFIMFLWGVAKAYIFSGGSSEAVSEGHRLILWGIIGFVVMISLWGIVNVVANTFQLTGYGAPILPKTYPY